MKESVLKNKSYAFAVRIVKLAQYLQKEKKEFVLRNQILRSGTSIGALVREGEFAQSIADFTHKMSIAPKETNETSYWISLLIDTGYLDKTISLSMQNDCDELTRMLIATVKISKKK